MILSVFVISVMLKFDKLVIGYCFICAQATSCAENLYKIVLTVPKHTL